MNFILQILISTLAVLATSAILDGVEVESYLSALIVAVVLAFLNSFIKPLMVILTLPITVGTFGLFLLIINAFLVFITDKIVDGFEVRNFFWAFLFSISLSIVTSIFEMIKNRNQGGNEE